MFSSANPWHGFRPEVFLIMRQIDLQAAEHDRRARALAPQPGRIPVGGAHFDECVKRDALEAFLRGLRFGHTPAEAEVIALDKSRELVRSWNRAPRCASFTGKHEVGRWEDTCAAMLADVARRFAGIGDPPTTTPTPEPPRQMVTGERLPYATRTRGRRV